MYVFPVSESYHKSLQLGFNGAVADAVIAFVFEFNA